MDATWRCTVGERLRRMRRYPSGMITRGSRVGRRPVCLDSAALVKTNKVRNFQLSSAFHPRFTLWTVLINAAVSLSSACIAA